MARQDKPSQENWAAASATSGEQPVSGGAPSGSEGVQLAPAGLFLAPFVVTTAGGARLPRPGHSEGGNQSGTMKAIVITGWALGIAKKPPSQTHF